METLTKNKLFIVLRNLHDIIAQQQAQLDIIANSHFQLADVVSTATGTVAPTPPPTTTHAAIAIAKDEIDELERIFNKPEKDGENE